MIWSKFLLFLLSCLLKIFERLKEKKLVSVKKEEIACGTQLVSK